MFLLMLPWTASDRARDYAADVALALARAGISRKEAAITMGITESLLSEQLHCVEGKQLSASRLAELPQSFQDELLALRAERSGALMLRRDVADLFLGAATLGRKAMAKALLSIHNERRRA